MKRAITILAGAIAVLSPAFVNAQPGKPTLTSPADGSTKVSLTALLAWNSPLLPDSFRIQIAPDNTFNNPVLDVTQGNSNVYTPSAGVLNHYRNYFWRVQGIDNLLGAGAWSDPSTFRTIDTVSVPPMLIKPANNAKNIAFLPDFQWGSVARATRYQIQLSSNPGFTTDLKMDSTVNAPKTIITYNRDTLKKDTVYYWRMRSENEAGWGPWSNERPFQAVFLPPSIPQLVYPANGKVNETLTVKLDWEDAKQANRYKLFISDNPSFTTKLNGSDSIHLKSEYQVPLLPLILDSSKTYYWTVAAGNDEDFYSRFSDTFSFTTINLLPPSRPYNISPATSSVQFSRTPTFTWNDTGKFPADSFYLHISTFFIFTDTARLVTTTAETYTIPASAPLKENTVHYWRVAGKNDAGFSPWSFSWNLTTSIKNPNLRPFQATLYPNPATIETSFEFEVKQAQQVRVAVTDVTGREVLALHDGELTEGKHSITVNVSSLPAGIYFAVIGGKDGMQAVQFIKQ